MSLLIPPNWRATHSTVDAGKESCAPTPATRGLLGSELDLRFGAAPLARAPARNAPLRIPGPTSNGAARHCPARPRPRPECAELGSNLARGAPNACRSNGGVKVSALVCGVRFKRAYGARLADSDQPLLTA